MMEETIKAQITELIKDKPELVTALNKAAELAVNSEKIREANNDLTAQRSAWGDEKKGLQDKITDLETKVSAGDAGGNNEQYEARIRGLENKLEEQTAKWEEAEADKLKIAKESREKDLRSTIISEASKKGDGKNPANNPEDIFHLMGAKNLIGFDDKNEPFFHKTNEKGEPVATTADDAVSTFLGSNPAYVAASGSGGGSGGNHSPGSGSDFNPNEHL